MPRGGRRAGAGRPTKITEIERLAVGARCEELWRTACDDRAAAAVQAMPRRAHIDALHLEINGIPIAERVAYLRSDAFANHQDDLEGELRIASGMVDDDTASPSRVRTLLALRPYGCRSAIVTKVAQEFPIASEHAVRLCWKEWRNWKQRLNNDLKFRADIPSS